MVAAAVGCSSSSASSSATDSGALAVPSAASQTAGVQAAKAELAKYLQLTTTFKAPGPTLKNAASLRGKTITYVPFFLEAPYFQAEVTLLQRAASVVGMKVNVCNAAATPTGAASCINQAVATKAGGIITDSIPYSFATNAYAAAAKAGIPVVASDIADPVPSSLGPDVQTMDFHEDVTGKLVADEIIADSGGHANVLLVVSHDVTEDVVNEKAMQQEFAANCPGCKVTPSIFSNNQLNDIASAVSVALTQNPDINYVVIQYDEPEGPLVLQGIVQVHATSRVKIVSQGSFLFGLQKIAAGQQLADVNSDPASGAWNEADLLFRMMTKSPIPSASSYDLPIRLFDKSNVGSLALTATAYASGQWYTNGGYASVYRSVWP
jgi:ribose transport system substrate-binding protein